MLTDSSDAAIIEAGIRMSQALGIALIAEGV
jgi:EAL domain-containing protein (putative c-di-GMP-specific phosphodiesterase class I)